MPPSACAAAMAVTEETRVFGASDKEQPSWQDTNMALFGSDIEHKIKEAAANGEPQWLGPPRAGSKKGLQVWRVEKFKVAPWPKTQYGEFHIGDSYIVLNTYCPSPSTNPDALAWDVHFWIGSESTQDEYGTAAYKTVELDDFLNRRAVQYREVQSHETRKFMRLFPRGLKYLQGGVATGFKHVEAESREPVLLQLKGRGNNVVLTQVTCKRSAMNSGDVYILDVNEGLYQWNGAEANGYERARAAEVCAELRAQRGQCEYICFEEGSARSLDPSHPFAKHLPVLAGDVQSEGQGASAGVQAASHGGEDVAVKGFEKRILALGIVSGELQIVPVGAGKLPRDLLRTDGVYVVDSGFHCYLWVGTEAPFPLRVSAFNFAQAYLKRFERPAVLPLTRFAEGGESPKFLHLFLKPRGFRIDADPDKDPERYHPMMRRKLRASPLLTSSLASPDVPAASTPAQGTPPAPVAQEASPPPATNPVVTEPPATKPLLADGDDDGDEDEDTPDPRWQDIPWAYKLMCHHGTCYPVVSDAWGCCLTSCGCSWRDRVSCCGMDVKGLYSPCVQVEAMCLKPYCGKDDATHRDVWCVCCQGYTYCVVPECKCCKGSQQMFCCQQRCSMPCDDEVPSTCTVLGHQRCQRARKTGDNFELVPFLPYPEVRIMDENATKRGGGEDKFNVHWCCQGLISAIAVCNTPSFHVLNACCGFSQSVGFDFPSCLGANVLGTCCCCLAVDCVACKPVERHPRVTCIAIQGGAYVITPRSGPCIGCSICKGTGSICCLEHRYGYPAEETMGLMPCRCTVCGGQLCKMDPQHECDRRCCVQVEPLPRAKPAVAEASDVVYHETRADAQKSHLGSKNVPDAEEMQRV